MSEVNSLGYIGISYVFVFKTCTGETSLLHLHPLWWSCRTSRVFGTGVVCSKDPCNQEHLLCTWSVQMHRVQQGHRKETTTAEANLVLRWLRGDFWSSGTHCPENPGRKPSFSSRIGWVIWPQACSVSSSSSRTFIYRLKIYHQQRELPIPVHKCLLHSVPVTALFDVWALTTWPNPWFSFPICRNIWEKWSLVVYLMFLTYIEEAHDIYPSNLSP